MNASSSTDFLSTVDSLLLTTTPSADSGLSVPTTTKLLLYTADVTSTVAASRNRELNCKTFTFVVYVVLFGPLIVFGLVGNTLSFIVLQFDRQSHAATFLLQVTPRLTIVRLTSLRSVIRVTRSVA